MPPQNESNGTKARQWIVGVLVPLIIALLTVAVADRITFGNKVEENTLEITKLKERVATKQDLHDLERTLIRCINAHQRGESCDL